MTIPTPRGVALVAALALAGCDGLGGSAESRLGPPPTFEVISRSPGPGREGVPLSVSVTIVFNVNIDPASIQQGVVSANGATTGTLAVNGNVLDFTPSGGWIPGSSYAIALSPEIRGSNGAALGPYAVWGFKTEGVAPPTPDTLRLVRPRP